MSIRMIDYYVKGLSFDARREIFTALEKINTSTVEKMLEKEKGYPRYKSMRFSDEEIAVMLNRKALQFRYVNELMIKNGRPPLFSEPDDTYLSSLRYVELMRRYRERESDSIYPDITDFGRKREMVDVLIEIMGCPWKDYIPQSYSEQEAE